uniref:PDZ domain-containing protein n=1 Tax=Steinernema glaseri TaxID=37863 RepID=A0A1I8AFU7_9BILA
MTTSPIHQLPFEMTQTDEHRRGRSIYQQQPRSHTTSLDRSRQRTSTSRLRSSNNNVHTKSAWDIAYPDDIEYMHDNMNYVPKTPSNIKRILLTRKYKDANVYNDLGIRVTGGKRLPNGELGAFVTSISKTKLHETLGEIKEGDQVLEWNGVLLRGKTFEEVERIIASSKGEIEVIIQNGTHDRYVPVRSIPPSRRNLYDNINVPDRSRRPLRHEYQSHEAPPVPAHRFIESQTSPHYDSKYAKRSGHSLKSAVNYEDI